MKSKIAILLIVLFLAGCSQKNTLYSIVQEDHKDGVIDQSGYIVVKPQYKQILNFDGSDHFLTHPHLLNLHWIHDKSSEAYAIVQNVDGKFGVINQKGKLLLKPIYESITYFFDGFMKIEVGGNYGLVNRDFKIVLKPIYTSISEFTGNIAIVEQKSSFGCINKDMELKIKPTYDKIYFQKEDFLRTTLNGKWGYLDNQCNVLSKPIFDYAYDFSNKIAKVILDNKVGYINDNGKIITKQIFTKKSLSF